MRDLRGDLLVDQAVEHRLRAGRTDVLCGQDRVARKRLLNGQLPPRGSSSSCAVWRPLRRVAGTSGYPDEVDLWDAPVAATAHRHDITEDDIRHSLRNLLAVADDPIDDDVTLFLGPDRAGNLVEVGVLATDDGPVVIHAMAARASRFPPSEE